MSHPHHCWSPWYHLHSSGRTAQQHLRNHQKHGPEIYFRKKVYHSVCHPSQPGSGYQRGFKDHEGNRSLRVEINRMSHQDRYYEQGWWRQKHAQEFVNPVKIRLCWYQKQMPVRRHKQCPRQRKSQGREKVFHNKPHLLFSTCRSLWNWLTHQKTDQHSLHSNQVLHALDFWGDQEEEKDSTIVIGKARSWSSQYWRIDGELRLEKCCFLFENLQKFIRGNQK